MNPLSKPITTHQANQEIESLKKKNTRIDGDIQELREKIQNAPKYSITQTPLNIYLEHLKGLRVARDKIKELKDKQHCNNEAIKNFEAHKDKKRKIITQSKISELRNTIKNDTKRDKQLNPTEGQ